MAQPVQPETQNQTQKREDSMSTDPKSRIVNAPTGSQANDNPMNVYNEGDTMGAKSQPKGAEVMKARAALKDSEDDSFTEKGEEGNPYPAPDKYGR